MRHSRFAAAARRIPTPLRLALGLAAMIVAATLLLLLPFMGGTRPLAWNEAFFTAVSALTVTGLSIIVPSTDLSTAGKWLLLFLIQVGGVGYMVVSVLVFRFLGRSISFADRIALRDSFGLLDLNAIVQLTRRVLWTVAAFELTGAFLLWLHWRSFLGDTQAAFYALFHAVSAFCNAGFDLFAGLPGYTGIPSDDISLAVLGTLIFLGGLGIPVIADLFLLFKRRRMSLHSRLTLMISAFLIVLGTAGLFLAESRPGATLDHLPAGRAFSVSLFQAISARTAGFSAIDNFYELSPSSQLLKIGLMFVGTAPASMGGGITTGTLVVLLLALWAFARGRETPHVFGRSLGLATVRRASSVLTISLLMTVSVTWFLLMTHPGSSLDHVLFEVISAFSTCGLSLNYTSNLSVLGQVVIALVMFWGRLGALTIIFALAQLTPRQPIAYPEEQILI
jgi:trk system potassium uptake protein TrkH